MTAERRIRVLEGARKRGEGTVIHSSEQVDEGGKPLTYITIKTSTGNEMGFARYHRPEDGGPNYTIIELAA